MSRRANHGWWACIGLAVAALVLGETTTGTVFCAAAIIINATGTA